MQSKYVNPVTLLVFMCVSIAFTLGGAPPSSAISEDPLEDTYIEPGPKNSVTYNNSPLLTAGFVPVPLQVQLVNVTTNGQFSSTDVKQFLGGLAGIGVKKTTPTPVKSAKPATPKKPYLVHTVKSGDTLSSIASVYGIDVDTLVNINMLGSIHKLKIGQKLNVITVKGLLYTVKKGENLWDIAKRYKIDVQEIVKVNNLGSPDRIQPKQMIVLPGAKIIPQPTVAKSSNQKSSSTTAKKVTVVSSSGRLQRAFQWPVRGRVTSRFGQRWGRMHEGIDIGVPSGTPVRAASSGKVTFSGWGGAYGYLVKIDHGNGVETRYGHNSRLLVRQGQTVSAGQAIARSGSTGRSTGPHVHFEIRKSGRAYNPLSYLR